MLLRCKENHIDLLEEEIAQYGRTDIGSTFNGKDSYVALKNLAKNKQKISVNNLSKNLLTKNIPDPDFLIRTGNTKRLSNFLLWQLAYAEIYFEASKELIFLPSKYPNAT